MNLSYDVFEVDASGDVLWNCAAENLAAAKEHVSKLGGGEYLILDQRTQQRIAITVPQTMDVELVS